MEVHDHLGEDHDRLEEVRVRLMEEDYALAFLSQVELQEVKMLIMMVILHSKSIREVISSVVANSYLVEFFQLILDLEYLHRH